MVPSNQDRQHLLASILREHADCVAAGRTLDVTLAQLARGACDITGCLPDWGLIRIIDPDTLFERQDVRSDGTVLRPFPSSRAERRGIADRAIRERQPQIVEDVSSDPDYVLIDGRVHSEMAVPLLANGKCWGVLNLESDQTGHFTADMISWVESLASQAVLTIQGDMLRARLERVRVVHGALTATDSLQADLRRIATEALTNLQNRRASVHVLALTSAADALVTLAFAAADQQRVFPGRFAPDSTIAWRAVRRQDVVEFPALAPDDPQTATTDARSAIALPLRDGVGFISGVLSVEAPEAHALDGAGPTLEEYRRQAEEVLREADATAVLSATSVDSVMVKIGRQIGHLVDPRNLTALYELVLRRTAQMIGDPDAQVAIAFVEQGELTIRPQRTYNYRLDLLEGWSWPVTKGITGRAVREQRSMLVQDVHNDPDYYQHDPTICSELVAPLIRGGNVLGVIDVSTPHADVITSTHEELLQALADTVAPAIDRAEHIRRGTVAQQQLELIHTTNEGIEEMLSQDDIAALRSARERVLRRLVRSAMDLTGSHYGMIVAAVQVPAGPSRTTADAGTELVVVLVEPRDTNLDLSQHWPVQRGVTGEVYRGGKTRKYPDLRQAKDFVPVLGEGVTSELAVPIRTGDRIAGVLNLEATEPRAYAPEQVAGVELLASQIANVMSAADLRLLRRQLERLLRLENQVMLDTLYDETDFINLELQDQIVRVALELTEQSDGYASLWRVHRDHLHRHAYFTLDTDSLGSNPVDITRGGIVGKALAFQVPIMVLNVSDAPWDTVLLANWTAARSALAVPLLDPSREAGAPGRVLGVLNVESRRKVDFSDRDVEILRLLAQAAVAAIRNRDVYRSKVAQIRDVTHTFAKVHWPLQISLEELKRNLMPALPPGELREQFAEKVADLDALVAMGGDVLEWFRELVPNDAGRTPAELRQTSLTALVSDFVARMQFFADDRAKGLRADVPPDDVTVLCMPKLIEAALFLLTENALRYGPEGDTVWVRCRALPGGRARIEVVDAGEPIPIEERDQLFEPGFRGSATMLRHSRDMPVNAGIGLDHVHRIVEQLHHGMANYDATTEGNVFYMELPPGP